MTTPDDPGTQPGRTGRRLAPAAYTAAQAAITVHMTRLTVRLMRLLGIPLTVDAQQLFALRLFPDLQRARVASYQLAADLMAHSAHAAGEPMPPVAPITPYNVDALAKVLDYSTEPVRKAVASRAERAGVPRPVVRILDSRTGLPINDLDNPSSPRVIVRIGENTGAAVARHANQAGRDAVRDTAASAGEEIGWARVTTSPHPCAFCAMLASRGPVYTSERTALYRGYSVDAYHFHCDCRATLVFKGKPWHGQADYERLQDLWTASTSRKSGKAAIAAFRSALGGDH